MYLSLYFHFNKTSWMHSLKFYWCILKPSWSDDISGHWATAVISLYLWKAFDMFPHCVLLSELERDGFEGWIILWVNNWSDGHSQRLLSPVLSPGGGQSWVVSPKGPSWDWCSSAFSSMSWAVETTHGGWWGTGTGCPRRLWMPHPCRHARPGWMWLWAAWAPGCDCTQ